MHSRFTEHDHVKTNLPHKIHRIRNISILKLVKFKELISSENYANCLKKKSRTMWYPLTIDVFATLLNLFIKYYIIYANMCSLCVCGSHANFESCYIAMRRMRM